MKNRSNLTLLADFLEVQVEPKKFSLDTFRGDARGDDASVTDTELLDPGCGSTGCALGWACLLPVFKRQGLTFNLGNGNIELNGEVVGLAGRNLQPLADLFDISQKQIKWIFYPDQYDDATVGQVVARLRHIAAGGKIKNFSEY